MARPVSVVIVSRDRQEHLRRCLTGVSQLRYPNFEVVVVADPAGLSVVHSLDPSGTIKTVLFDTPNISQARNLACAAAAGDVIAFLDDDAVPEPTWLHHLIAPFDRPDVGCSGGFVRGRNGISWQWKARRINHLGQAKAMDIDESCATVFAAPSSGAIKTEGTNMAVQRSALVDINGFDPAFHFYLDETDLNMRLARAGWATAIVPMAQVHHGFAASKTRRQDRAPRTLFDIGASWAVFLRKHVPEDDHSSVRNKVVENERVRALTWMQRGGLDAQDVVRLLKSLRDGFRDGEARTTGLGGVPTSAKTGFSKVAPLRGQSVFRSGWTSQKSKLMAEAKELVDAGNVVTLFLFSPSALFHHHVFSDDGVWIQTGGVWGKSDRKQPLVEFQSIAQRKKAEIDRICAARRFDMVTLHKKA